jgi:UDP-glucose 4-epimerase
MIRSLVTGGAGFIGSHLVDKLVALGQEVIVIDDLSAECNDKFYYRNNVFYNQMSITDYKKTKSLYEDIDYVFHLAAESKLQPAILNPIQAMEKNVVGTCTVLQCAKEAGVKKVIYSSTSSGYGLNQIPNVETQSDNCLNPYSVSKIAGEKLCRMYNDLYGLKTISLRYFNVYGDRAPQKGQYALVLGIFKRQKEAGEPLTIVGTGLQRRDFIHVSDVVEANFLAAMENVDDECYGKVYNIGSGNNYSILEIAQKISDNIVFIPPRIGEAENTLSNIDLFSKTFNWSPKIDLIDWLAELDTTETV